MFRSKSLVVARQAVRAFSYAAKTALKPGLVPAPREGSCGIAPWDPRLEPPPPSKKIELPSHLIRPPCLPGSKPGGMQTCMELKGLYCPPCRAKYRYPPFSDNIDFVPPGAHFCWWRTSLVCKEDEKNQEVLSNITRGWDCNYE